MTRFRPWFVALIVVSVLAIGAFALWQWNANRTPESTTAPMEWLM